MSPEQKARQGYLENAGLYVARNTYQMAECPRHGETPHLSYLGGRCSACASEAQVQGPKKPSSAASGR